MYRTMTLLAVVSVAAPAFAATTTVVEYNMGEDNTGAMAGDTASTINAEVGATLGSALNAGGKFFSSDVPTNSLEPTTLSVDYDANPDNGNAAQVVNGFNNGNNNYDALDDPNAANRWNNFGVEAFVKVDNLDVVGDRVIFNIGNPNGVGGVSLRYSAGLDAYFFNVPNVGNAIVAAASGDWDHLAFVRDQGRRGHLLQRRPHRRERLHRVRRRDLHQHRRQRCPSRFPQLL